MGCTQSINDIEQIKGKVDVIMSEQRKNLDEMKVFVHKEITVVHDLEKENLQLKKENMELKNIILKVYTGSWDNVMRSNSFDF